MATETNLWYSFYNLTTKAKYNTTSERLQVKITSSIINFEVGISIMMN